MQISFVTISYHAFLFFIDVSRFQSLCLILTYLFGTLGQIKNGQRLDLSVMHLTIISRTRHLVKIFHVQMLWSLPL